MRNNSLVAFFIISFSALAQNNAKLPLIMDMVHNNPGEPVYISQYNNPDVLTKMGYNSKCFFLFDSPMLAINWDELDIDVFPKGSASRAWVEHKAKRLDSLYSDCKKNGIDVYAMSDLILFPKKLVQKYGIENIFGNPQNSQTEKFLRFQLHQMFAQFPQMDGLVVRIGETYLEDAPYHVGKIKNKEDAQNTIIPLLKILRDEVCVKLNKKVIFRTWYSFDVNEKTYREVDAAIEPHKNLIISVKHCEGDFHRGNPFSKVLGIGRHKQIVEVQCAREYEGKGAYPDYIANGVINGFEEHKSLEAEGKIWNLKGLAKTGKLYGVWTWTRGGGWEGPYIKNELWSDLNAWVMAQWANNTNQTEESIFQRYATERLKLSNDDAAKFRQLALLSAQAVIRGRRSVEYFNDINTWWTRDEYITFPVLPKDETKVKVILAEKDKSIAIWKEIVAISKQIKFKNKATERTVICSSLYGLYLYRIYRSLFYLSAIDNGTYSRKEKANYIAEYDAAWKDYQVLPVQYPDVCATLYNKSIIRRTTGEVADLKVDKMR
ncbi:MAG: hypothetical protein GZ091_08230 [Paludibacter sp.]|nr:hypothetical protein [Paludibacter sp.]